MIGRLLRDPSAVVGAVLLGLLGLLAVLAPLIYPDDPMDMVAAPFVWPGQGWAYPLGTDSLGRDVAAGIAHGARVTLFVGLAATLIGTVLGVVVGGAAGYLGGVADDLLVRVIQVFHVMPSFVLLIVLVAIAEPSVTSVTVAIGILTWPPLARLVRAEVRSLKQRDFIAASHGIGQGHLRRLLREILPNALPPVIVAASTMVASAILSESALSFMGLGDPNVVSWGSMIGSGREFLRAAWYLAAVPGIAIIVAVFALNLLGDALNHALDPRSSHR